MGNLNKLLVNYTDIVFLIAIIELILIIIIIVYLVYIRQELENERQRANFLSNDNYKKAREAINWRDEYYRLQRVAYELKNEKCIIQRDKYVQSNQTYCPLNVNHNNNTEYINSPKNGNITKERPKKIYVQETTNDDGTIKHEINFDIKEEKTSSVSFSPKFEYLEAANAGQFRKLLPSDEKCFFRTWEENGSRRFEFHGNVDKALANINAIFDDVCEIEGKRNGATNIENVEPGILDDKLNVEKPAKIKLV